jgi:hypothetical protein
MFSGGVELVHLDAPDLGATLTGAIRSAWEQAPAVRAGLRARADVQILRSRAMLDRVFDLVDAPRLPLPEPIESPA